MKLFRCPCWLLLWLLAPGLPLRAAQTGLIVEKIEIKHVGPPAVSDDLVRANIHVKVGDAYNPNATTEDIRTLKTTGFFYNIQVAAERTDGGLKLIYVDVVEKTGRFEDRKSTRLNSSHQIISYAVFCLKK